ncbi:hypothetical protein ACFV6F_15015 [Kitasatospora phosalacinea]|uniref:hypothetical protein n=1 Tax=Kitasatospora phosalacinea TaxID=2065 RepID=UPI0036616300
MTGLGLVTPGGCTVEEVWEVLCRGRGTARRDPELAGLPVDVSCRVTGFDAETELERVSLMGWTVNRTCLFGW